jgi:integrase
LALSAIRSECRRNQLIALYLLVSSRTAPVKGKGGGRVIPLHPDLRAALVALKSHRGEKAQYESRVIYWERGLAYSPNAVAVWFHTRYGELNLTGASSHSGRRTFITTAARKVSLVGGSLNDVRELAGHASLATTQRYIQCDGEAQRKLIDLL